VHVTLRAVRGLASFRREATFTCIQDAIGASSRDAFRVTHFSVQRDHIHLLVEASTTATLSAGMRGLAVRLARRLNRTLGRRGALWADRWHAHPLRTPREVRNAIAYVLFNARKHGDVPFGLDPYTSVCWSADALADPVYRAILPGFRGNTAAPVRDPQTWLLRVGWRRRGLLRMTDLPRRAP